MRFCEQCNGTGFITDGRRTPIAVRVARQGAPTTPVATPARRVPQRLPRRGAHPGAHLFHGRGGPEATQAYARSVNKRVAEDAGYGSGPDRTGKTCAAWPGPEARSAATRPRCTRSSTSPRAPVDLRRRRDRGRAQSRRQTLRARLLVIDDVAAIKASPAHGSVYRIVNRRYKPVAPRW